MKRIEEILKELGTDDLDEAITIIGKYSNTYYRLLDKKNGSITGGTPEFEDYILSKKEENKKQKDLNDYKNKLKNMGKKISIEKVKNGYIVNFGNFEETVICQTPIDVLKELTNFYEEFKKVK